MRDPKQREVKERVYAIQEIALRNGLERVELTV